MKSKNLITVILLTLIALAIACSNKPNPPYTNGNENGNGYENGNENYPRIIPFTEFSLAETSCRWWEFFGTGEVAVINSNEELENRIICSGGDFPEIDFSKYTLLLAGGSILGRPGAEVISIIFYKSAANEYNLNLTVRYGAMRGPHSFWFAPILVSKIADETVVELDVYQFQRPIGYVENELMIWLERGVDAHNFAASHSGIYPRELLTTSWNIWLFGTDGTEDLDVLINRLSRDNRVVHVQRNHTF